MTKSLPLRLKDLFFPAISVRAQAPTDKAELADEVDIEDIDVSFSFQLSNDGTKAHASLALDTKEERSAQKQTLPYKVSVEVVAGFEVIHPEHQDDRALWMRKVAAATALIGAAREQVATTTARGPWGPCFMPIIGLTALVGPAPQQAAGNALPSKPVRKKIATKPKGQAKLPG